MTTEVFIEKQRKKFEALRLENKPLEIAAKTTMALQAHRIFVDGKNSSGGNIGQYNSTTPFYIDPDYSPRASANKAQGIKGLKREGKYGDSKFLNGKNHKTSFQKSYKDFKRNIGQKNDKVRFHLSGDLESDFRNAPVDSSGVNPKKISVNEYQTVLTRDENVKKLQGLEGKFTEVTDLTKGEKELFLKTIGYEFRKQMST